MTPAAKKGTALPNGLRLVENRADGDGSNEGAQKAQRERVLEAVLGAGVTFWRDADGTAYATVPARDAVGQQRYRVRSRRFALIVRDIYGRANQRTVGNTGLVIPGSVSDTAMAETLPALEAIAMGGPMHEADVRVCRGQDAIWLDLGDAKWRLVRVDGTGWRVVDGADLPLIRSDGLRALPVPMPSTDRTKTLHTLRELLNVAPDRPDDLKLLVAWLMAALYPSGPYPILAVDGEQGSAKSTACRMLRRLVDPNKADLRAPPRSEDNLVVAALNSRVVAVDNVSFIEADTADALCRLATGAGLSKRKLYSDGDEHLVAVCRPVLLNGIPSLLARGDLADRAIAITLPAIPDANRRPESEVWRAFGDAAPSILALLLDGVRFALANLPTLSLPRLPRMADFARLACAAAPAFGWTAADMLTALEDNRANAVQLVIEADPVAVAVCAFIDGQSRDGWTGTATTLLDVVNKVVPDEQQREKGYPRDATRLSARLRRIAPAMRRMGWNIVLPTGGGRDGRNITIKPTREDNQRSERSERSVVSTYQQPEAGGGFI